LRVQDFIQSRFMLTVQKIDGWTSYGVVLFSDGRCRIFSSETDIDLGGRDNGVFESKLQEVLAVEETGIEKEMGK